MQDGGYTTKVDIWGLGCILYQIIFKERPFRNDDQVIRYANSRFPLNLPFTPGTVFEENDNEAKVQLFLTSIIRCMLEVDLQKRPDADSLNKRFCLWTAGQYAAPIDVEMPPTPPPGLIPPTLRVQTLPTPAPTIYPGLRAQEVKWIEIDKTPGFIATVITQHSGNDDVCLLQLWNASSNHHLQLWSEEVTFSSSILRPGFSQDASYVGFHDHAGKRIFIVDLSDSPRLTTQVVSLHPEEFESPITDTMQGFSVANDGKRVAIATSSTSVTPQLTNQGQGADLTIDIVAGSAVNSQCRTCYSVYRSSVTSLLLLNIEIDSAGAGVFRIWRFNLDTAQPSAYPLQNFALGKLDGAHNYEMDWCVVDDENGYISAVEIQYWNQGVRNFCFRRNKAVKRRRLLLAPSRTSAILLRETERLVISEKELLIVDSQAGSVSTLPQSAADTMLLAKFTPINLGLSRPHRLRAIHVAKDRILFAGTAPPCLREYSLRPVRWLGSSPYPPKSRALFNLLPRVPHTENVLLTAISRKGSKAALMTPKRLLVFSINVATNPLGISLLWTGSLDVVDGAFRSTIRTATQPDLEQCGSLTFKYVAISDTHVAVASKFGRTMIFSLRDEHLGRQIWDEVHESSEMVESLKFSDNGDELLTLFRVTGQGTWQHKVKIYRTAEFQQATGNDPNPSEVICKWDNSLEPNDVSFSADGGMIAIATQSSQTCAIIALLKRVDSTWVCWGYRRVEVFRRNEVGNQAGITGISLYTQSWY